MYVQLKLSPCFIFVGVDEFAAIILKYSGQRVAQLSCSIGVKLSNEAVVTGTAGKLKLPYPFWCPTKLETSEVSMLINPQQTSEVKCVTFWT